MNPLKHFIKRDEYSNSKICEQCGKWLYTNDAKFCSMRCEKLYRADQRLKEALEQSK